MKSNFKFIKFLSVVLLGAFLFCGCPWDKDDDDDNNNIVPLPDPSLPIKTIMVYLDADNNLEGAGVQDLNEMEAVDLSGTDLKIVVLMDRIAGYDSSAGDWTGTRLYEVAYDSGGVNTTIVSTRLSSSGLGLSDTGDSDELNMGAPATLSNFINFCKSNYEGNYALILWNHGGGWRERINQIKKDVTMPEAAIGQDFVNVPDYSKRGVCWDETDGDDNLYMDEVQTAVKNKALTVIGFDACLMGMLEVAYEIRNYASYMIASEESEPGDGWEYNVWLTSFIATGGRTAVNLCNAVVDAYETRYSGTPDTTLSAIDLSKIDAVFTALNSFSTTLYNAITNDTDRDNVRDNIFNNVEYYNYSGPGSENYVDLWHMADVIQTDYNYCDAEAAALKTSVENAVIDEWSHAARPNSHGLSINYCYITGSGYFSILYIYCYGYTADGYPNDFVQNTSNTYVARWNGSSVVGPGLLYRLIIESL